MTTMIGITTGKSRKSSKGFLICLEKKDILKINYKKEVSFVRKNVVNFNE